MHPEDRPEPEIEVIDRTKEDNGDYSFTFIMTWPAGEGGER